VRAIGSSARGRAKVEWEETIRRGGINTTDEDMTRTSSAVVQRTAPDMKARQRVITARSEADTGWIGRALIGRRTWRLAAR
jgi:hypothetical protein